MFRYFRFFFTSTSTAKWSVASNTFSRNISHGPISFKYSFVLVLNELSVVLHGSLCSTAGTHTFFTLGIFECKLCSCVGRFCSLVKSFNFIYCSAEPQGLGTATPRLSWKLAPTNATERGTGVSAYRIVAARSIDALKAEKDLLWDTGIVPGAHALANSIEYSGTPLRSRDRVVWRICTWDQAGRNAGWSAPASFSVGLLAQDDWANAEWIGLDASPKAPLTAEIREELRRLPFIRQPGGPARKERQATFRTTFKLKPGTVTEAWFAGSTDQFGVVALNASSLGAINRWNLATALDAKTALVASDNTITVTVRNEDGFNPAASGMLMIRFADNSEQRIALDKSWQFSDAADTAWKPVEESRSQPWGGNRNTEHFMGPAPYLRTTFTPAAGKSVANATLYSTAMGVYEPRLNGHRIGTDELTPGWTEFSKRVYHQTYDVTSMINAGPNCLGAVLGDGWYAGLLGYTGKRQYYGGPARFKAKLELTYTDGSTDTIATSPDWVAAFSPITHNDLYMGSGYDARLEMPGWDTASFNASSWKKVHTGLAKRDVQLREADVTDKVRAALKTAGSSFTVNPQLLGDPAFGVVKTLRIDYTAAGTPRSISFKEGESVSFPRAGESGDVAIVKPTSKSRGTRSAIIPVLPETLTLLQEIRAQQLQRHADLSAAARRKGRPAPVMPLTVLSNTQGRPWKVTGLDSAVQDGKASATPPIDKHLHDTRGTFGTRLRKKARLTASEIAQILGWDEARAERLLAVYVDRDDIVRSIAERIRRNESGT